MQVAGYSKMVPSIKSQSNYLIKRTSYICSVLYVVSYLASFKLTVYSFNQSENEEYQNTL